MLSLDEAISQEKELFEHCKRLYEPLSDEDKSINPLLKNEIEYHKQLAEWLEELKILRENANGYNKEDIELNRKAMYNKAIDDFVKELKNHYTEYNIDCVLEDADFYSYTTACNYLEDYIDEIAEQLKAGGRE